MSVTPDAKFAPTHLCAQEPIDVLEDAQQQLAAFLSLLLRLTLNLELLLLRLGEHRFELFDPLSEVVGFALELSSVLLISFAPCRRSSTYLVRHIELVRDVKPTLSLRR